MKYKILRAFAVIAIILIVIYGVYLRFSNPDMTETRLLITYWKQHLCMLLGVIVSIIASTIAEYKIK